MTFPDDPEYLLPPEAYYDPEWYRREQQELFGGTWHLAGHRTELAGEGRRKVVEAGPYRLVVQLDADGAPVASHLPAPAPPGLPTAAIAGGPGPARAEVWEELVFVHPDPDAAPLEAWLAGVGDGLNGYRASELHVGARGLIPGAFNWKLFAENHIDVLHLWYLHATTLPGDHNQFEWRSFGPHWVSYEPLKPDADRKARFSKPIAHVAGGRGPKGIGAHLLFPNIVHTTGRDSVHFTTLRPTGPERCVLDVLVLCEPGAELTEQGEQLRRRVPGSVLDEDLSACEGMQALVRSSAFRVGPLAREHERPIHAFHQALLACLGAPAEAPS